jgi:hypothetical protein
MADPRSTPADDEDAVSDGPAAPSPEGDESAPADPEEEALSTEELRRQVEEKYDFDNFGPEDMAQMSYDEWDVAFDAESWITGDELLDRVANDIRARVAQRDVFARVERHEDQVIAYSDEGYAVVYPDGTVEGEGTVLRDVKPTVALASMESYDVPEVPPGRVLPEPEDVPEGTGELGNLMLQVVAGFQLLAGLVLIGAYIVAGVNIIALVAGLGFIVIGVLLFTTVANARLSDKFRAEEYRGRLRAIGLEDGERPDFVPLPEENRERHAAKRDATADEDGGAEAAVEGADESGEQAQGAAGESGGDSGTDADGEPAASSGPDDR